MPLSLPRVRTAGAAGAGTPAVHRGVGKHAVTVAALGAVTQVGPMVTVLIVAGAGSGKTAVLTRRIAHLIRQRGGTPVLLGAAWFIAQAREQRALWESSS